MQDLYATTHVVGYNCNLGGGVSDLSDLPWPSLQQRTLYSIGSQ